MLSCKQCRQCEVISCYVMMIGDCWIKYKRKTNQNTATWLYITLQSPVFIQCAMSYTTNRIRILSINYSTRLDLESFSLESHEFDYLIMWFIKPCNVSPGLFITLVIYHIWDENNQLLQENLCTSQFKLDVYDKASYRGVGRAKLCTWKIYSSLWFFLSSP